MIDGLQPEAEQSAEASDPEGADDEGGDKPVVANF
jgi:hypothetical protein